MKKISLIFGIVASLAAGTGSLQAGHCGTGFYAGFWPLFSFGVGFGLGSACSYPYRCYPSYSYSSYPSCGYSSYGYAHSGSSAPATTAASTTAIAAAPVQEAPPWKPTTPALGRWVPDPQPYIYNESATAIVRKSVPAAPASSTPVSVIKSPGRVPTYVVSSPGKGPNS